jgi:thiol-disulfide isomerase/thioredoxin
MRSTIKITLVTFLFFSLLFFGFRKKDDSVKVYKIDDLVNRISNDDTTYVINFWATWCKPCVAELPEFEKLNNDSAGTKLKVLLVSMDFVEDLNTRLKSFLKKNNYKAEVVLLNETDATTFIPKLDNRWGGSIPATLVKHGGKKAFAEKKLTIENLLEMVKSVRQDTR